jgi:HEAT repeat protein
VVETPPAEVVVQQPERYRAEPETIVFDPVADALKRLQSNHDNSRRDGALTLGRLGDARAVPALMQRLRFDEDTDVRAAAAYALGDIGDPQARPALERAAMYDRKKQVRDEAALAIGRLVEAQPAQTLPLETTPEDEQPRSPAPTSYKWSSRAQGTTPPPPNPGIEPKPDEFPDPLPPIEGPRGR